nr:hypothetical protein [archaeon]
MKSFRVVIPISVMLGVILIMVIFSFQVNPSMSITGNVVGYSDDGSPIEEKIEFKKITKTEAQNSIEEAEKIIEEMSSQNMPTNYVKDLLIDAKTIIGQADNAEIVRGSVEATKYEVSQAKIALSLINWENIFYSDVISYADKIKNRQEETVLLYDKLSIEESKIKQKEIELEGNIFTSPPSEISSTTQEILEEAKIAFEADRLTEAEILIDEFRKVVEEEKAQESTISGIKSGAKNFFQRYWIHLIILAFLIYFTGRFIYKKFEKRIIKNKIKTMNAKKIVLTNLIKKTQEDHFKKNIISGFVYKIRMNTYKEGIQTIKQELPVLELRLRKLSGNKKKLKK